MIRATVIGTRETIARLAGIKSEARQRLKQTVARLTLELLRRVKAEKLSGQVLNVRTGRLRRSINQRVLDNGGRITGIVGTNVEYGRIHELGLARKASKPVSLKVSLRQMRVAAKAKITGAGMNAQALPQRSFLRSALNDMNEQIQDELRAALTDAFKPLR